jgi:hypothetical protein
VVIAVAIPDNVVKSIWNWLVGRIWKSLEMTAREALECCNLSLMSDSGVSAEDQNAARNFYIKECTYNASDGNKDNIRNWTWGHSCYILAKNLSTFCLFLDISSEDEFKSNVLLNLVEEISRHYSI